MDAACRTPWDLDNDIPAMGCTSSRDKGPSVPSSNDSPATAFAKSEIASNDVVVFSKSYCPYCKKTKETLSNMGIDAKMIELDQIQNGDDVQEALISISQQMTVPNVFIKGVHLGGNDDLQAAAKSGKLKKLLK